MADTRKTGINPSAGAISHVLTAVRRNREACARPRRQKPGQGPARKLREAGKTYFTP